MSSRGALLSIRLFSLVHHGINSCYGGNVEDFLHGALEVDEVDWLVQAHLDGADDLHIGAEGLQHLV